MPSVRAFTSIGSPAFLLSILAEPAPPSTAALRVLSDWPSTFVPRSPRSASAPAALSSCQMKKQTGSVFDHHPQRNRPRPKVDKETAADNEAAKDTGNDDEKSAFDPTESFLLSDLVGDLNCCANNYFCFPTGAQSFLRDVLTSGPDFQFVPMDQAVDCKANVLQNVDNNTRVAYISSCLDKNEIHYNLRDFSPKRVGEAICHELLHYQDFRSCGGFRPITSLVYCKPVAGEGGGLRGSAAAAAEVCKEDAPPTNKSSATKAFQPLIAKLVNLISHEYVKAKLEKFGYVRPFVMAMENQLTSIRFTLQKLEETMHSVSEQLVKLEVGKGGGLRGKKPKVGIYKLQKIYENLILSVLMDELLFIGGYAHQIDDMMLPRFQHVLDYIHDCTSPMSNDGNSIRGVNRQVAVIAWMVRDACKRYHEVSSSSRAAGSVVGDAKDRYNLLVDTLNATFDAVGIYFTLLEAAASEKDACNAPSIRIDAESGMLGEDELFLLDGEYPFADAKSFAAMKLEE